MKMNKEKKTTDCRFSIVDYDQDITEAIQSLERSKELHHEYKNNDMSKTHEIIKNSQNKNFSLVITNMENEILANLSDLDRGYGRRKWAISKQTGIPEDILTVLLKRLKLAGKVELIMIWSEETGLPDGSGYCLQGKLGDC